MSNSDFIRNIIDKYFEQNNVLTNHQIESYDDFIDNILPTIISQYFPLYLSFGDTSRIKNIKINVNSISIETPQYTENNGCTKIMTPSIARLRNLTYSLTVLKIIILKSSCR
jgi:DNA-directed RNA polymerase beta subunit